jgi:8-oxo-dGTP pyrophosphatase MutT (NUDIX family)
MSYLDRVRACNRLDLTGQIPFLVDGAPYGWVRADRAAQLARHPNIFSVAAGRVTFADGMQTVEARTAAIADVTPDLVASGLFGTPRGELYAAKRRWADAPAFLLDRKLAQNFGLRAFGVHVNGVVGSGDDLHLWIGTRAADRDVEPGKLDNMVAGGQPAGLTLMENLVKECAEEADLPADLVRHARPVGAVTYAFTAPGGIKADTMFCYDLEVPPDVMPRNTDGEIAGFTLMPVAEVLRLVRETDRFKFNVNLVIIHFALRHGLLDPDRDGDLERLLAGLNRRPEADTQGFIMEDQ